MMIVVPTSLYKHRTCLVVKLIWIANIHGNGNGLNSSVFKRIGLIVLLVFVSIQSLEFHTW